jgi:hypothetical protein
MTHRHEFHALYWHFGKYGPQDVHMHPCECGTELQGPGERCDGDVSTHQRVRWNDARGEWIKVRTRAVVGPE